FVFIGTRTRDANFWFALLIVPLGQGHDLAEQFAALLIDLHLGCDLAVVFVDRIPFAHRRLGRDNRACARQNHQRYEKTKLLHSFSLTTDLFFESENPTAISLGFWFSVLPWTSPRGFLNLPVCPSPRL